MVSNRPAPFRQAGFADVDFLSATDESDEHGPIAVPVHDAKNCLWLRFFASRLLLVLFRIPSALRFIKNHYVFCGRLSRSGKRIAHELVDILDKRAARSLCSGLLLAALEISLNCCPNNFDERSIAGEEDSRCAPVPPK